MHLLAMNLGSQALVVKECTINHDGPEYVMIKARKAGLLAWLMTKFGIDVSTTFKVLHDHLELTSSSLSGELQSYYEMKKLCSSTCGYLKPIILFVFAVISAILSLIFLILMITNRSGILSVPFLIFAALTGVCIVAYYLNKNMLISVLNAGGELIGICFKRSVIEGVEVTSEQAHEVISIINKLIAANR